MAIRNAAKAIVIRDGKVLLNRCVNDDNEIYYDLPGGGQHQFKTMEEAVMREVLEETGYYVKINRFVALAEEIYDDLKVREKYCDYSHRILHIFLTELANEQTIDPIETDFHQEESVWLSYEEADKMTFCPRQLSGRISQLIFGDTPQYLGNVHISNKQL